MHAADAPGAATCVRRFAEIEDAGVVGKSEARPAVFAADPLEAEHAMSETSLLGAASRSQSLRAVQPADLALDRNDTVLPRRKRASDAARALGQREPQPVRIDYRQDGVAESLSRRAPSPRHISRGARATTEDFRGHLQCDFDGESVSHPGRGELCPRERT